MRKAEQTQNTVASGWLAVSQDSGTKLKELLIAVEENNPQEERI
jgi:hypothetical protein